LFSSAYAAEGGGLTKTMAGSRPHGIGSARSPADPTDLEQWRFGLEASFFGSTVAGRSRRCAKHPPRRIGAPEDAGRLVAFLASEASRYITGQAINLDGGQCMEL
jgi:NAD(P)-dependent dehydrogenase (short-subunit alcohol dehydrogenase family)